MKEKFVEKSKIFSAFTLAEMMVVLLILSIVLAAMAPVMTTKMKSDKVNIDSSPWRYVENSTDAYLKQIGDTVTVLLGHQREKQEGDNAKLVINNGSGTYDHIIFKHGDIQYGGLKFDSDGLTLRTSRGTIFSEREGFKGTSKINFIANDGVSPGNLRLTGSAVVLGDNKSVGSYTVAIGKGALFGNEGTSTGANNTAIGSNALNANTSGASNTALGSEALKSNTKGARNIALGSAALKSNTEANNNVAIGFAAMEKNTGASNIAIGRSALGGAVASGDTPAISNTGNYNIGVGYNAMKFMTSGNNNIALGQSALGGAEASGDTPAVSNTGGHNTAIGYYALQNNTTGTYNIGIGREALNKNSTGSYNTAMGYRALQKTTNGESNIALGYGALYNKNDDSSVTNKSNIAIGCKAMGTSVDDTYDCSHAEGTKGNNNIAIGSGALGYIGRSHESENLLPGNGNIAIGRIALSANRNGKSNIGIGPGALLNNLSGSDNIAIGRNACLNVWGSNKTCIGEGSGPKKGSKWAESSNTDKVMFLGDENTTVVIPGKVVMMGGRLAPVESGETSPLEPPTLVTYGFIKTPMYINSNNSVIWGGLHLESSGAQDHELQYFDYARPTGTDFGSPDYYYLSDRRLKYVGKPFEGGLDKIKQLKVFNYTFKKDDKKTPRVGVMAQDLQKIFPDAVKTGPDGFLQIRMEDMFYALVNAVKELDAKITQILQKQEEILRNMQADRKILKQIQNENKQLKKENADLKVRLERLEAKIK